MKNLLKKYQLHFYFLAQILISIGLSLYIFVENISSADLLENAGNFLSLNSFLKIPQIKLSTGLYLYYLYVFIAALLFHVLPKKWQWIWLLLISIVFLALWDIFFFVILIFITGMTYFLGRQIEDKQPEEESRVSFYLGIGIISCVVILLIFKYGPQLTNLFSYQILMPLGISYYTFQAISYLMDIYSGKIRAERHFGYYAIYLGFFPKLFVGPIERAGPFIKQMKNGINFDYQTFLYGIVRTFWGLFKKVMVVNRLAVIVENVFSTPEIFSGAELWVGVFLCGFYIYFDFSAFIDIAIGISQLFGIKLTENFKRPYLATSITDFWRRWHISLSSWLRDYIFIPLNFETRRASGKIAQCINIMLTFLISGIWHGSAFNFIVWGGMHGFYQMIEYAFKNISSKMAKKTGINLKINRTLSIILTFIVVNLSWVVFYANSLSNAWNIFRMMFTGKDFFSFGEINFGLNKIDFRLVQHFILFFIGVEIIEEKEQINLLQTCQKQVLPFRWLIYLIALFVMIIFGHYGKDVVVLDPYYMQF